MLTNKANRISKFARLRGFTISRHDLTGLSESLQQQQLRALVLADNEKSFDLAQDLMVRASHILLQRQPGEPEQGVLVFNMHHIASDGWSVDVLNVEFISLYQAYVAGQPNPLAPLNIQYADFAVWQREHLQGEVLQRQLDYWGQQLSGVSAVHELPLDAPRPEVKSHQGARVTKVLDAKVAEGLQQLANQYRLTPVHAVPCRFGAGAVTSQQQ